MPDTRVPNYLRIKSALLEEINRGLYLPDRSFITEREICERFGVSRATAVRALGELVHDGVLTRHRGRGTFVTTPNNLTAPREADTDNKTRLIGCIFHRLQGQHPMSIIRGIEHVCHETDYHLLLFDSKGSARTEAINLERARNAGVQGLIVYPVDGLTNTAHFEALQRDGVPFVMIDRYYPALPSAAVIPDNIDIGYRLTDYLIRQGHRNIALVIGEEVACTSVEDRLVGYRLALRDHGIAFNADLAALRPYAALPEENRRALLGSWLGAPYRPTAYLAINSQSLVTVTTDLFNFGIRLPGEVVVASMDNSILDALLALTAATVALPSYEMGSAAMRLLLERLAGHTDNPAQHVVLPIEISTTVAAAASLRAMAT